MTVEQTVQGSEDQQVEQVAQEQVSVPVVDTTTQTLEEFRAQIAAQEKLIREQNQQLDIVKPFADFLSKVKNTDVNNDVTQEELLQLNYNEAIRSGDRTAQVQAMRAQEVYRQQQAELMRQQQLADFESQANQVFVDVTKSLGLAENTADYHAINGIFYNIAYQTTDIGRAKQEALSYLQAKAAPQTGGNPQAQAARNSEYNQKIVGAIGAQPPVNPAMGAGDATAAPSANSMTTATTWEEYKQQLRNKNSQTA